MSAFLYVVFVNAHTREGAELKITTSLALSLFLFLALLPGTNSVRAEKPILPGVGDGGGLTPIVGEIRPLRSFPSLTKHPG